MDTEVIAQEQNFGDMYLIGDVRGSRPGPGVGSPSDPDPMLSDWTGPYYHVTDNGLLHFGTFGGGMAPIAVQRLLQRQGIDSSSVTFTGHQASQRLLDAWKANLNPGAMFQTLAQYGNMTVANIPLTFAPCRALPPCPGSWRSAWPATCMPTPCCSGRGSERGDRASRAPPGYEVMSAAERPNVFSSKAIFAIAPHAR